MGWYTLDSHSMTAKLVSHNEGQRLSEDAFESGLVKVEIFLEQREVGFFSPSKIFENLNFSIEIQIFSNFAG